MAMTAAEAVAIIKQVLDVHDFTLKGNWDDVGNLVVDFDPCGSFYPKINITYDELKTIAKELGTTNINFWFNAGWQGTEVTPGDAATLALVIGGLK